MLSVLNDILCWVKQIGAMVASGVVDAVNGLLDGLVALVNAAIAAWPFAMPTLPTIPSQLYDALGWLRWGPLGIVTDAVFALLAFLLAVYVAVMVVKPLLGYGKVLGD